jgi:hypothetical protein
MNQASTTSERKYTKLITKHGNASKIEFEN